MEIVMIDGNERVIGTILAFDEVTARIQAERLGIIVEEFNGRIVVLVEEVILH